MSPRHISAVGLDLIKRFEGYSATPYLCPANKWTIGYGHVILPGEEFGYLSPADAEVWLRRDVAKAESAVRRLITVSLHQLQFDALVSFTYNLGGGALQRSTLRRKVNRGEHEDVPAELLKWTRAGAKRLGGLVKRRQAEAALYQQGWLESLPWAR